MPISILSIIFQLTIFALIVLQLVELTKQYFLPALRNQIALFKKRFVDLKDKVLLAKKTKNHLEKKIKKQEEVLVSLEENIKEWHAALEKEHVSAKKRAAELVTQLQAKKQKQLAQLARIKERQAVVPLAVEEARARLMKKYGKEGGKKLLEKLLKEIA